LEKLVSASQGGVCAGGARVFLAFTMLVDGFALIGKYILPEAAQTYSRLILGSRGFAVVLRTGELARQADGKPMACGQAATILPNSNAKRSPERRQHPSYPGKSNRTYELFLTVKKTVMC
jgi:hypothetical protein